MTKQEIKDRITKIEKELFNIEMIDHWTPADKKEHDKLYTEWLILSYETKAIDE